MNFSRKDRVVTEREQPRAAKVSRERYALAAIMVGAFLLRVWHLSSGVPFAVGIDEPFIMSTAMGILMFGTRIVSEAKGLALPGERYSVQYVESLAGADVARFGNAPVDVLIVSSDAWGHAGQAAGQAGILPPSHRHLLNSTKSSQVFRPRGGRQGPTIVILVLNR